MPDGILTCATKYLYYPIERWYAQNFVVPGVKKAAKALEVAADDPTAEPAFDHSQWDACMKAHVSRGVIDGIELNVLDYKSLAADERMDAYRKKLAEADPEKLVPNERLALYINAYNVFCAGLIVAHLKESGELPKSINDLSKPTPVWKKPAGTIGGKEMALDDVEHAVLRTQWAEPRVHASIVCASASCPDLRAEAFVGPRINAQMDDQSRTFVANERKGVARSSGSLTLSRIFLWFGGDFKHAAPSVGEWACRYLPDDHPARAAAKKTPAYFEYNWKLNVGPTMERASAPRTV